MAADAFEERDRVVRRPDYQPVPGVSDMAFVSSTPIAGQGVHVVAAAQLLQCFRGVLHHQVDDFFKLGQVPVASFGVLFSNHG